tara:strand:- start:2309 stop:2437 length:129 start_codon:yes stop_codon:yes gene_type:complete
MHSLIQKFGVKFWVSFVAHPETGRKAFLVNGIRIRRFIDVIM